MPPSPVYGVSLSSVQNQGIVGALCVLLFAFLVEDVASQVPCAEERICQGDFDLSFDDPGLCTVIDGSVTVSGELVFSPNCVNDITRSLLIESNVEIGVLRGFEVRL